MQKKISKTQPVPTLTPGFNQSATEMSGIAGIQLQDKLFPDEPQKQSFKNKKTEPEENSESTKKVLDALVDIADASDHLENEVVANFFDFLILKFAQTQNRSEKLRQLIIDIGESDLAFSKDLVFQFASNYSNVFKNKIKQGGTADEAKEEAFLQSLQMSPQIIESTSIKKEAQILQENPKYVAQQIYDIIDVMVNRISINSRYKAKPNIKKRIEQINIFDVSKKRAPGGAAIGLSIGLVKNILNGQEPHFIQMVIDELAKLL
jgi:hypothetical protein